MNKFLIIFKEFLKKYSLLLNGKIFLKKRKRRGKKWIK